MKHLRPRFSPHFPQRLCFDLFSSETHLAPLATPHSPDGPRRVLRFIATIHDLSVPFLAAGQLVSAMSRREWRTFSTGSSGGPPAARRGFFSPSLPRDLPLNLLRSTLTRPRLFCFL